MLKHVPAGVASRGGGITPHLDLRLAALWAGNVVGEGMSVIGREHGGYHMRLISHESITALLTPDYDLNHIHKKDLTGFGAACAAKTCQV